MLTLAMGCCDCWQARDGADALMLRPPHDSFFKSCRGYRNILNADDTGCGNARFKRRHRWGISAGAHQLDWRDLPCPTHCQFESDYGVQLRHRGGGGSLSPYDFLLFFAGGMG